MIRIIRIFFFLSILSNSMISQPSLIFKGGTGDGYHSIHKLSSSTFYSGGFGQGYSQQISNAQNELINALGGPNDGYHTFHLLNQNIFYTGGLSQGYSLQGLNAQNELINALGGPNDGYTMELNYRAFIWTGKVGEGWGNADNWNYFVVPDVTRKTIIPADAINWPFVNAGIFAIGENPAGGAFTTAELFIEKGAQLTTRLNNFVQNYGLITIEGLMTVKNGDANAFINNPGSILSIQDIGVLEFDPN